MSFGKICSSINTTSCCAERLVIWNTITKDQYKSNWLRKNGKCTLICFQCIVNENTEQKIRISRSEPCLYCTKVIKKHQKIIKDIVFTTSSAYTKKSTKDLDETNCIETKYKNTSKYYPCGSSSQ